MRLLYGLLIASIVAALAAPGLASAAPGGTRGVVVQRDGRAGAVVIATRSGSLQRVKFAKPNRLAMGTVVRVLGSKVSVVGHTHKAKLHGVVVRRSRHSFALAGNDSVLAVASTSPPAAGEQVTTNVEVGPAQLSDNDGECHVEDDHAPAARLRGTVLGQDATTLTLSAPGFPAGLPIALGTLTIPNLVGMNVKARVALGPDPANAKAIVLTLVSIRVDDDGHGEHGDLSGATVKGEGVVTQIIEATATPGAITIDDEHGTITFVIPVGFGPTGVLAGDEIEAWGTAGANPGDPPTLVRLESSGGDDDHSGSGHGGDDSSGHGGHGSGTSGDDD